MISNAAAPLALTGNAKALDKFRFEKSVATFCKNRPIKYSKYNLYDHMAHLPQDLYEVLYPQHHAYDVAVALHVSAVTAALNAEPPTPPPLKPAAPSFIPRQPAPEEPSLRPAGASSTVVQEHQRAIDSYMDYRTALLELQAFVLPGLDQYDYESLVAQFSGDLTTVDTKDVFAFIWKTYPKPSPALISLLQGKITAKLDRSVPLLHNFNRRFMYNADLLKSCPTQAYTSSALFLILFELCKEPTNRLRPIVYQYTLQPGYDYATAQAKHFADFMVATNLTHMHDEGTGHLAFQGEDGYVSQQFHPLALATPAVPNAAPPPLALAAPAPPAGTPPRAPRIRPFGSPSRLPGGAAPAGYPPGKICFEHGFQRLHNSRSCPTMEANPGNYTFAQRSLVRFPAGSNPMIDGKMCNLTCAPGVGPHP